MLAHRAKVGRTSLPGPWIGKQYHVLGMCVRSFPRLHDFNVQYRIRGDKVRNHPNIFMHFNSESRQIIGWTAWSFLLGSLRQENGG